jgi:ketosteroid isomerase-like protein
MKRISLLSFCLIAAAGAMTAAEPTPTAKQAVMAASQEWTTAVLKADKTTLEKLLSPDLSYTHSSAKTQTKEEFIQDATRGGTKYESIDFDGTKLRQYGNTVVMTHNASIKSIVKGAAATTSHLYITEVWAQQSGRWQMVSRQATKLP